MRAAWLVLPALLAACDFTPAPTPPDCGDAGADGGSACPVDAGCQATSAAGQCLFVCPQPCTLSRQQ